MQPLLSAMLAIAASALPSDPCESTDWSAAPDLALSHALLLQASDEDLASAFRLELQYARVEGRVQVREQDHPGSRLRLSDLGIRDAAVAAVEWRTPLSESSRLRWRLRWWYESGSSSDPGEVEFNGVRYEAGATLHATPLLGQLTGHWERDLFTSDGGARLALLAGFDLTYLDFKLRGPEAADTHSHDERELFWKQAIPFPSLGLRFEQRLSDAASLYAECFGFRAIRWYTFRSEGGPVHLSQDRLEATVGATWRFAPHWELDGGLRFDWLAIDETSREDGNHFVQKSFGPFVALSLRF